MKCYICDAQLSSDEIKYTPAHGRGGFAPCGHCQQIIEEVFEPIDEQEVERQLNLEFLIEDIQEDVEDIENSS